MARSVSNKEALRRSVKIEAAGDPLGQTDEQIKAAVDSDFVEGADTFKADEYQVPIDHKKAIDDILKNGNALLGLEGYNQFLALDDEGRKKFVDEWHNKRTSKENDRLDTVQGL